MVIFFMERKKGLDVYESDWSEVISGIPQGSVLGPLFFVMHINGLSDSISNNYIFFYSDNTKVVKPIYSTSDCEIEKLQVYIEKMNE